MTASASAFDIPESLSDTEFELDGVEFRVLPIPFADGQRIVDEVRVTLRRLKDSMVADSDDVGRLTSSLMLEVVSLFSVEEREALQARLFKYVEVRLPDTGMHVGLLGNESAAFKSNVLNAYVVLVRAFTASFLGSFRGLLSTLGVVIPDLN